MLRNARCTSFRYDNIWISADENVSSGYTGDSGVTMVDHEFYPDTKRFPYKSEEAKAGRKACNKTLSDHRPVWASFKADHDHDGRAVGLIRVSLM